MWTPKYTANEYIYETETDSEIERTDLCLPRRVWGKEGLGV